MKKLFKSMCLCIVAIFIVSLAPVTNVHAAMGETKPNDTVDTATVINVNTVYKGNIVDYNDYDYYKVVVPNDGEVSLNFSHKEIPGDSNAYWEVRLFDSQNNVYIDYRVRGNEPNLLDKRGLAKGTYYLKVNAYNHNSMDYNVSVALKSSNYYEKEINDSMASANLINLNTKYTGNIYNYNDYDYYKVIVPNDGDISLNFDHKEIPGDSYKYWEVSLLDSKNNVFIEYYAKGNEANTSVNRGIPKGTYYLRVKYYNYNDMDYNISVGFKSSNYYEKEFNDSMSSANSINLNTKYTGNIYNYSDVDYYKFVVENTGDVSVNFTQDKIEVDGHTCWSIKLLDSYNNEYLNYDVKSSDATVQQTRSLPKGTYYVKVDSGYSYYNTNDYKISVNTKVSTTSVTLNKTSLSLEKGKAGTLTATATPSNASNKAVTWSSSNTKVATVDSTGKVTAVGAGSANIIATAKDGSGKSATCKVTVTNPVSQTSIKLNKTSLSMTKGKTETLIATVISSNKAVTWSSTNTKVATVDSTGKVTAVGAGTANIICTTKDGSGKSATCKVTVTEPVVQTSIKLNKTNLNMIKGNTETLIATVISSNKAVIWSSSNTNVATVDSNGKIIAVGVGEAYIICITTDGSGKSATCKVAVTNPISVTSIKLNKTNLNIVKGKTETLIAIVTPTNAINKAVVWRTEDDKIAKVDENGKITTVGYGTTNIYCMTKEGNIKIAVCKVTVTK